jgi:hypothetical protein
MNNSNNRIKIRTRDIPDCSAMPFDILPKININITNLWQSKNKETTLRHKYRKLPKHINPTY